MAYVFAGRHPDIAWGPTGRPQPSVFLTVYLTGTLTLAALYTDRTKGVSAPNPTQADTEGNYAVIADPGTYDVVLYGNAQTVTVQRDPLEPSNIIATGTVTDASVAAANIDGLANVPSMRTLGTGAQQSASGAALATETTNRTNADSALSTAVGLKAPSASPTLTGTPTAPTASPLDNSTKLATTAYSDLAVGVEKSRALAQEAVLAATVSALGATAWLANTAYPAEAIVTNATILYQAPSGGVPARSVFTAGDWTELSSITPPVGTTSGTIMAGDDTRVVTVDAAANVASRRTLGTGAGQAAPGATTVQNTRQVTVGSGLSGGGDLTADRSFAADFGTAAGKVTQGNDSRLSDARTPTTHATSHAPAGTDDLTTALSAAVVPVALGTAALGAGTGFTRQGHVHPTTGLVLNAGPAVFADKTSTSNLAIRAAAGDKVAFVTASAGASDSNDGLSWGSAFATIGHAISSGALVIFLGYGNFAENTLSRPDGCSILGPGSALCSVTINTGQTNGIQDAGWGTSTVGALGGLLQGFKVQAANLTTPTPQWHVAQATTTYTGSAGTALSALGTLPLTSLAAAYATGGQGTVAASDGTHVVTYTGVSGSNLTGCTYSGSGAATLATSAAVGINAVISASATTVTLDSSAAALPSSGTLWIGNLLCSYSGTSGSSVTGVVLATALQAGQGFFPGAAVTLFASTGHAVAIQSAYTTCRDVVATLPGGSGFTIQGYPGKNANDAMLDNCSAFQCGRYSLEVGEIAPDGSAWRFGTGNAALGDTIIRSLDWNLSRFHPTGVVAGGIWKARNAKTLLRVCAGSFQSKGTYFDTAAYDSVLIDMVTRQQGITDVAIDGQLLNPSFAASGGGAAVTVLAPGQSSLAVQNVDITLKCSGRISRPLNNGVVGQTIGAQGAATSSLQVLNALLFHPQGSLAGGTVTVGANAVTYTSTSSATGGLSVAAVTSDTTLTLESDPTALGFAASGTVTAYPLSTSTVAVPNTQIAYTGINSGTKQLTGVTGIPAGGFPIGTGIAQHFLTGCANVPATADLTTITQTTFRSAPLVTGRMVADTFYNASLNPFGGAIGATVLKVRYSGSVLQNPNPFKGTVSVAAGASTGSVNHNLQQTPNFVSATPNGDPQQRWWVAATSTQVTVTLAANAVTNPAVFWVEAANTPV